MARHSQERADQLVEAKQARWDKFYEKQEKSTRLGDIKSAMLVFVPVAALGLMAIVALVVLFS